MPRRARSIEGGLVYHILNRSSTRMTFSEKDEDCAAFERVLEEAHEREPLRVRAYCVLPNHWHFVPWPERDGELRAFMRKRTILRSLDLSGWIASVGLLPVYCPHEVKRPI